MIVQDRIQCRDLIITYSDAGKMIEQVGTKLLKDGTAVPGNVEAPNVFETAREYLESIKCGDLKVNPENVIAIIDIPG